MAYGRAVRGERRLIQAKTFREEMLDRGWCEALVPIALLEELGIPCDTETGSWSTASRYSPNAFVYAPAWVYGVVLNIRSVEAPTYNQIRWQMVKHCLMQTRDSIREQEVVSSELSLNIDIKRSIREAARSYVNHLQKARET